ncbi:MAG TPA: hypothetical protein VL947_10410 [Cytophagales bacterium]|nr:hypothetical protein [Cytophagales bacterium]
MKKVLITLSLLTTLGMVYANVDGKEKGKSKKSCCAKSKSCCTKAKADSTQQKGTEQK